MPSSIDTARAPFPLAGLGRDAGAALIVSLAALSFYVSVATLLFQGALAAHLPAAIGATLVGSAVLSLMTAWRGAMPLASAGAVPSTVPVLAAVTASIAAVARPESALPTAVVALALAAAATGGTWWLMGRRGWGGLVRYVPYPVIGGFMGATGWLIAVGGLGVATGQRFNWPTVLGWLGGAADARLAVGAAIGVLIWFVTQRLKHPLVLPALLLAGGLAIHAGLAATGVDLQAARALGWLQAPFNDAVPAWPLQPGLLAAVQWELVLPQLGWIVSCVIVGTLSLLLTTTGLEVAWDTRADINRDLRALGQGNLLAAAAGGLSGGLSLSRSALNVKAGAQGRASGVMLALLCLLAMAWGGPFIALVPLPLLGGLLLAQGIEMLKAWLVDSRARLSRRDHLTVLAMVGVTAALGFLPAVCLGVLACCVDFAVSQAQFPPVRRLLTRASWLSNVERPVAQAEWLMHRGASLHIVELQGVLFFGSATRLSRRIEAVLDEANAPTCLLFDFHHVRTIDSSAAQSLARLFKTAQRRGIAIELSGLNATQEKILRTAGALAMTSPARHASIDAAVSAWDEAALAEPAGHALHTGDIEGLLSQQVGAAITTRLLPAFEAVPLAAGEVLFERGAASDALYVVASGRLAIVVPDGDSAGELTVRTLLPGSTVGEMGLFRHQPRSATVRAEVDTLVLKLAADRLAELEASDPAVAAALYRLFVLQMASRVDQLTVQAHLLAR